MCIHQLSGDFLKVTPFLKEDVTWQDQKGGIMSLGTHGRKCGIYFLCSLFLMHVENCFRYTFCAEI